MKWDKSIKWDKKDEMGQKDKVGKNYKMEQKKLVCKVVMFVLKVLEYVLVICFVLDEE